MYSKQQIDLIIDRREMLRVKIKSLMAEAQIIRREERRTRWQLRNELRAHRVQVVRREARSTHVAYGLIRGKSWDEIEPGHKSQPDWPRVKQMLVRYGPSVPTTDNVLAIEPLRALFATRCGLMPTLKAA